MLVLPFLAQLAWSQPIPATLTGKEALSVLGQTPKSPELAAILEGLGLEKLKTEDKLNNPSFGGDGLCLVFYDEGKGKIGELYKILWQRGDQDDVSCPVGDFTGELPFGLQFDQPREEVRGALGDGYPGFDESDCWGVGLRWVCAHYAEGRLDGLTIGPANLYDAEIARHQANPEEGRLFDGGARPIAAAPSPAPVIVEALRPAIVQAPPVAPPVPQPQPVVPVGPLYPSLDEPLRTGRKATGESAVVIGLEAYPFLGSGVPYAKRDAQAFADFLVYTRGVPMANVQTMTGGSREQILAAVDRAAAQGETVWIYFAGHGAASPETGDRMLLGDDVRPDPVAFASRGVGVAELERRVAEKGGSARLVLDTCYTGSGRDGGSIAAGTRFAVPAYAAAPVAGSTQWNAASPDQVSAPIDDAKHGAFTYFALGAMRGWADGELDGQRDGKVTATEASLFVTRALRRTGLNGQTPVWVGSEDVTLSEGATETYTLR